MSDTGQGATSLTDEHIEKMQAEVPPYLRFDTSFTASKTNLAASKTD